MRASSEVSGPGFGSQRKGFESFGVEVDDLPGALDAATLLAGPVAQLHPDR